MDETVKIRATGLPPASPVTLTVSVSVEADRMHFRSTNFFQTSSNGVLDVENSPALPGGDYEGMILWREQSKNIDIYAKFLIRS